jgi:hypothetical protein
LADDAVSTNWSAGSISLVSRKLTGNFGKFAQFPGSQPLETLA